MSPARQAGSLPLALPGKPCIPFHMAPGFPASFPPYPLLPVDKAKYWVGQKVHLGFSVPFSQKNPNVLFGKLNIRTAWEGSTGSKKHPYKTSQLDKVSWAYGSMLSKSSKNSHESTSEVYWCTFNALEKVTCYSDDGSIWDTRLQWISNQCTDFENTKGD